MDKMIKCPSCLTEREWKYITCPNCLKKDEVIIDGKLYRSFELCPPVINPLVKCPACSKEFETLSGHYDELYGCVELSIDVYRGGNIFPESLLPKCTWVDSLKYWIVAPLLVAYFWVKKLFIKEG